MVPPASGVFPKPDRHPGAKVSSDSPNRSSQAEVVLATKPKRKSPSENCQATVPSWTFQVRGSKRKFPREGSKTNPRAKYPERKTLFENSQTKAPKHRKIPNDICQTIVPKRKSPIDFPKPRIPIEALGRPFPWQSVNIHISESSQSECPTQKFPKNYPCESSLSKNKSPNGSSQGANDP